MAVPYAFVTLISSDSYLPGALALAGALKDVHPSPVVLPEVDFQTVCLVTPETVDVSTIKLLRRAFDIVIGVETILQQNEAGLVLLGRLDLNTVLTKLHVFRLTQFSKIIFLDADILPIRPLSHLFTLPHEFSASPDVGWPDIFNSGMMVLTPGEDKFKELTELLHSKGSWDGGDQGLLNEWRGNNWNRLSFTYNTTPTAAYTYAPAYERFGSQISAIHFIGPNKPWNSLSYRSPFTSQPIASASSPQQAYDYNSLVDRWYDVYDRHYRSQPTSHPQFENQRYESAWNQAGGPPPSEDTMSLDELRRLAIEGIGAASTNPYDRPAGGHERSVGQYRSLPLEGRVDLMPPKKEPQTEEAPSQTTATGTTSEVGQISESTERKRPEPLSSDSFEEDPRTPVARHANLSGESPVRWHTLPTPGPNEIPPSPHPHSIPLPPVTPGLDSGTPLLMSFPTRSEPESPSNRPDMLKTRLFKHAEHLSPLPAPFNKPEQRKPPPRPHSPTMLLWNPAIEPPPKETPAVNAFPTSTYFTNAWDASSVKSGQQQSHQPQTPVLDSRALFEPLPRSEIPDSLIKQGHYRNVTGDDYHGVSPSPDTTKVKPVFPWEEKPRHLPGRVFPVADSPKPTLFLSPESQSSQTSSDMPTTPEVKSAHPPPILSPLHGLPPSFIYPNAWDTVPSIQKYAERLVRPPATQTLAPAFEEVWDKKQKGTWDERVEASSRDGDVEDEGENSDEERPTADTWENEKEPESSKQRHSRRGSSATVPKSHVKVPRYREVGVQTIIREMKEQSVQTISPPISPPSRKSEATKKPTLTGRRHWAPASRPNVLPSVTMQGAESARDGTPAPSSSPTAEARLRSPKSTSRSPSISTTLQSPSPPAVRPSRSNTLPQNLSPRPSSPALHARVISRQTSNDSSLTSPVSSIGPNSPSDGQPISSPLRKSGRVWDPARGVELFKRGSEEVLARFLKMGSWEDENH
ncbi:hypothetical protein H0H87_004547 [Tephrocybe sp. NHM501043]|nr:hypothetical protein H0H87_004547 [Tephrocybe sp. NHM501043]